MRAPRAFRPDVSDHRLESREVLNAAGAAAAAAIAGRVHNLAVLRGLVSSGQPLQLNAPFRNGILTPALNSSNFGTNLSFSRTITPPFAGGFNSNLGFLTGAANGGLGGLRLNGLSSLSALNGLGLNGLGTLGPFSGINNGFFTTFNNPNAGAFSTGVSNGLVFNNGLGLAGNVGSAFFNNGASTGLAFNNGLGIPGGLLGGTLGSGFGTSSGLNFNNGLGLGGTGLLNGVSTGLNFNNGLGIAPSIFSPTFSSMLGAGSTGLNFNNGLGVSGLNTGTF